LIQPLIPLTRPEDDKKGPDDTLKFRLLSTPLTPKDSPTYEAVVNVFRNGTPEEYIKAIIATDKVCKEGSKYCQVPKTNGHYTKECKVLLAQVNKMSALWHCTSLRLPSTTINARRQIIINPNLMFSFMVNTFKATNHKEKSYMFNDKTLKANETYAFDDDIFDAFKLNDNVCNKDEANTDSNE
jgi:hypothetical protein